MACPRGRAAAGAQLHPESLKPVDAPPSITCAANNKTVTAGAVVQVLARGTSLPGRPLQYNFATNAGTLSVHGPIATVATAGLSPRTVQVVCMVRDDLGRNASTVVPIAVTAAVAGSAALAPHYHIVAPVATAPGPTVVPPAAPPPQLPQQLQTQQQVHPAPPPPPSTAPATPLPAPPPAATVNTAPPPSEYAEGDELTAWKKGLQSGAIEYSVPPVMTAGKISPVTVVIHGFQDKSGPALQQATGTGTLLVSSRMKVELLAPENPGEFLIAQQGGDPAIQFIPNDSFTTWMWDVTPSNMATQQELQIRVSLVFQPQGQGASAVEEVLEEKTYPVTVTVQKLGVTIRQAFWKDPLGWFEYMLPGGAGWGALAALVTSLGGIGGLLAWWKKRKARRAANP